MGVKLSEFASRIIQERKLIRENKGPSIVPLMIIRFSGLRNNDPVDYYSPPANVLLLTVCQRTAAIYRQVDLTKFYSGSSYVGYSDWWNRSEVVSIRQPRRMSTSRLLEIYVVMNEVSNDEPEPIRW